MWELYEDNVKIAAPSSMNSSWPSLTVWNFKYFFEFKFFVSLKNEGEFKYLWMPACNTAEWDSFVLIYVFWVLLILDILVIRRAPECNSQLD
jgi:hypothetical protein